jgi:hypothetical protein
VQIAHAALFAGEQAVIGYGPACGGIGTNEHAANVSGCDNGALSIDYARHMIYVLIGLVLFSIALVIYLNVAQNGKLPERGALVTPAVREALKVDQEALLLFHPQDDTPQ